MKRENGFSLGTVLIVILIAAIVVTASLYLLGRNKKVDAPSQSNPATTTQQDNQANVKPAYTSTKITSGQNGFSINIPTGWKITSVTTDDWLFAKNAEDTVYSPDAQVAVSEVEGAGFDGGTRFSVRRFKATDKYRFLYGNEENLGTIKAANATGTKYYVKSPIQQPQGVGDYSGREAYTYEFKLDDGGVVYVTYDRQTANQYSGLTEDQADILEIVDEAVASLTIN